MQQILLLLPLLFICLSGVLAVKLKLVPRDAYLFLNKYVIFIATPALTIAGIIETNRANLVNYPAFTLVNTLTLVLVGAIWFAILVQSKMPFSKLGSVYYTSMSGNVIYFGYPIILTLLTKGHFDFAVVWVAIVLQIFDLVGALMLTMRRGGKLEFGRILHDFITNPLIVSTLFGFVVFFVVVYCENNLPAASLQSLITICAPLLVTLDKLGSTASVVALFSLGVFLASNFKINSYRLSLLASLVKLLVIPAIIYIVVFYIFKLDRVAAETSVIMMTMPSAVFTIIASDVYGYDKTQTANTVMLSSLLFVVTLPFWLWVLSITV
jgi:predicted permease